MQDGISLAAEYIEALENIDSRAYLWNKLGYRTFPRVLNMYHNKLGRRFIGFWNLIHFLGWIKVPLNFTVPYDLKVYIPNIESQREKFRHSNPWKHVSFDEHQLFDISRLLSQRITVETESFPKTTRSWNRTSCDSSPWESAEVKEASVYNERVLRELGCTPKEGEEGLRPKT